MEELYNRKLTANYNTREVLLYDSLYSRLFRQRGQSQSFLIAFCGTSGIGLNFGLSIGMLAASIEYVGNLLSRLNHLAKSSKAFNPAFSELSGSMSLH